MTLYRLQEHQLPYYMYNIVSKKKRRHIVMNFRLCNAYNLDTELIEENLQ